MRFFATLAVSVVLAFSPVSNSAPPEPVPFGATAPFEDIQGASVTVIAEKGSGSGVIILATNGNVFCISAAHVIGNSKADVILVKQIVVNGRTIGRVSVDAEVISVCSTNDIAVLKARSGYFFKIGAKFESERYVPKLGESVTHCGSMQGIAGSESITTGIVSFAGRVMEGLVFDQVTACAMPGSSGGGVFNADGACIGIVVSGWGDNFSYIVPVRRIRAWVAEQRHPEWLGEK